jgi:transglutaminase-like putative cysteine protease
VTTILEPEPVATIAGEPPVVPASPPKAQRVENAADGQRRPMNAALASVATFLAVAAAGWMAAGAFRGMLPRVEAVAAALVGVGVTAYSDRTDRPAVVQALLLPVMLVVGAAAALVGTGGGNLPHLLLEALRGGGFAEPPVPYDPGWRFLLVVLVAALGGGATALMLAAERPKLGVILPLPVVFAAVLLQPRGGEMMSTVVALLLGVAAMLVATGVELARDGATSGGFEARRLARGSTVTVVLVVGLLALGHLGFLFPGTNKSTVIPPKHPKTPTAAADRQLFTYKSDRQVPLRLGVLDVYGDNAWLTPPYDTSRLVYVPRSGVVPYFGKDGRGATVLRAPASAEKPFDVTIHVDHLDGHLVPAPAGPLTLHGAGNHVQYDPRTQVFQLSDSTLRSGVDYTVEAAAPPDAAALEKAPPPAARLREFLQAPPAPAAVQTLLASAPTNNLFDRLQYVRTAYYKKVVSAGPGSPIDTPPSRVEQLLAGKPGSPYEISAAEVLLARWAGVPARLGFGYYGGDEVGNDPLLHSIRPRDGAMWLEVYFEGHGWVPIVGTPPRAQSSLSQAQKKDNPTVRPTDRLAVVTYVPVRIHTFRQLYDVVRYWVARIVPIAAGLALVLMFYPGLVKVLRRQHRRRWAGRHGAAGRLLVAYAELRDRAYDLNVGDPRHTPLEFLAALQPDAEALELAWLTTRGLWGDLVRDLRPEDADAGEDMAASLTRRLRRAAPVLARVLAIASRASLRDPYTDAVPNLWPRVTMRRRVLGRLRRLQVAVSRVRVRGAVSSAAAVVLLLPFLSGCGASHAAAAAVASLPAAVAPPTLGNLAVRHEPSLERAFARAGSASLVSVGRMYTIHQGGTTQGSLEVAAFKPAYSAVDEHVRSGVLEGIGTGRFTLVRLGDERVYELAQPDQTMYAWFAPNGRYFDLMVARHDFEQADDTFLSLLAYQRGEAANATHTTTGPPVPDPRQGGGEE